MPRSKIEKPTWGICLDRDGQEVERMNIMRAEAERLYAEAKADPAVFSARLYASDRHTFYIKERFERE